MPIRRQPGDAQSGAVWQNSQLGKSGNAPIGKKSRASKLIGLQSSINPSSPHRQPIVNFPSSDNPSSSPHRQVPIVKSTSSSFHRQVRTFWCHVWPEPMKLREKQIVWSVRSFLQMSTFPKSTFQTLWSKQNVRVFGVFMWFEVNFRLIIVKCRKY